MNLTVSASPHIRGKDTTTRLMLDVVIALLPALIAGVIVQGLRAALVAAVCVLSALAGEWLLRLVLRQYNTLPDGSALVTGLLLALTLPASVPYWTAAIGGLFAVIVVKGICGGLGQNTFNPALGARAFLMLLFPACLTRFPALGAPLPLGELSPVDVITGATHCTICRCRPCLTPLWRICSWAGSAAVSGRPPPWPCSSAAAICCSGG